MGNIQYHGDTRTTESCVDAIIRLIQFGDQIDLALLLTFQNEHAFLFTVSEYQKIVIQSGFSSGYGGEGPKGLALVLEHLRLHNIEIEEVELSKKLFVKLEKYALNESDLMAIEAIRYIRPLRIYDYIHDFRKERPELLETYPCVIPWRYLDSRIVDIAVRLEQGDRAALLDCFKRLEGILKKRAGASAKSIQEAARLVFSSGARNSAPSAREKMVTSIFTLYRNQLAHEECTFVKEEQVRRLLLINELYLLEAAFSD